MAQLMKCSLSNLSLDPRTHSKSMVEAGQRVLASLPNSSVQLNQGIQVQ